MILDTKIYGVLDAIETIDRCNKVYTNKTSSVRVEF